MAQRCVSETKKKYVALNKAGNVEDANVNYQHGLRLITQ